MNTIMGMFAKSPIKPLQNHSDKVSECCNLLVPFFESTNMSDWEKASLVQGNISNCEKEADEIKHDIRLNSPKGLFLAINRGDMLGLVRQQDGLANLAKDIAGITLGRKMKIPEPIYSDFITYLKRCLDAAEQLNKAMHSLDELLETGFKGREVDLISELLQELDRIEKDTDFMQINLRHNLMAVEGEYNPIDMMFLYENLKKVGSIADQAQSVGSRLEVMTSRI